jgi:rod shape-determining protein MreD
MIMNRHFKENILILVTFCIALVLTVLPQPIWMADARPQWVFVVLLFWLIQAPRKIGPTIAWIVGLYVDLLMGDVLGEHALLFVVFTYFVQHFLRMIQAMPLWQQILGVGFAGLINIGIGLIFMKFGGVTILSWHILLPAVANMVIWPWLYLLCRDIRPKHDFSLMHSGR